MTYDATKTFWLEPTDEVAWGLRRYSSSEGSGFDCASGHHRALVYFGRQPAVYSAGGYLEAPPMLDHADERWPTKCEHCDYVFTDDDVWQMWQQHLYVDNEGHVFVLHQGAPAPNAPAAPPGAMWDAWWVPFNRGPDDICLMVRLPDGHDWMVDAEAANCTRPGDSSHRCWVRHGDPKLANLTVDKNGETCAAGAGSIASDGYHGFLQNGVLTPG